MGTQVRKFGVSSYTPLAEAEKRLTELAQERNAKEQRLNSIRKRLAGLGASSGGNGVEREALARIVGGHGELQEAINLRSEVGDLSRECMILDRAVTLQAKIREDRRHEAGRVLAEKIKPDLVKIRRKIAEALIPLAEALGEQAEFWRGVDFGGMNSELFGVSHDPWGLGDPWEAGSRIRQLIGQAISLGLLPRDGLNERFPGRHVVVGEGRLREELHSFQ